MEDNYKTPSLLLSELKVLIGCQIIDMKKCSFDSYQDYTEYLDEVGIDHYRSKNSFFRYGFGSLLIEFNNNEKFDFAYVDELHSVVVLKDIDNSVLDEDGNFYIHTIVPELMWISNNPIDAFKNLLFGGDSYVLNEEKLQWISPKGTTQKYNPPINNELLKNPWWY